VVVVATSLPDNVLSVSTRNDVPLPNRTNGYPSIMQDFKGLRVGVAARGTVSEKFFNTMLADQRGAARRAVMRRRVIGAFASERWRS
jgi:hypothetical protein